MFHHYAPASIELTKEKMLEIQKKMMKKHE